jgi:hypothetical protein
MCCWRVTWAYGRAIDGRHGYAQPVNHARAERHADAGTFARPSVDIDSGRRRLG